MQSTCGKRWIFLLLFLPLAACGGEGASAADAGVRDSAGVAIVESRLPRWNEESAWRLSDAPSLEIGVVEGAPEYQLSQVITAKKLAGGQIVIADRASQAMRFFDAAGRYLRTSGRKGGGPGEFQALSWIQILPGDSIVAYDAPQRRLSTFDPEGALVATRTLEFKGLSGYPRAAGEFADGTLLVISGPDNASGSPTSGARRDSTFYLRNAADGSLLNPIVHQLGQESYMKTGDGIAMYGSLIFGRSSQYAVTPARLFAGETDRYEIGVYDPSGRLERLIRLDRPLRPVAQEDVDKVRSRQLATTGVPPQVRELRNSMIAEMPIPPTMPAFASLLTDDAGDLWAKEEAGADDPDAPSRWKVFDPDGRLLGELSMPGRFRPTQIGTDFVLGVGKDELDVEHVQLYGLGKPE